MTNKEHLLRMISKDLFTVANTASFYDVELPEEVEDFMCEEFDLDPHEAISYSFEELQDLVTIVLEIADENPDFTREPMVKFPLEELRKIAGKSEEEVSKIKSSQCELWKDMDNISACGGLAGFLEKHGSSQELLAAQAVVKAFLG